MNCCFASALPLLKLAIQHIDPFFLVALRMLTAGGILCTFQLLYDKSIFLQKINWPLIITNGILSMSLLCMLESWALQKISATKANLMWATLPLLTALVMCIWNRTSLNRYQIFGIAMGMVGGLLLIQGEESSTFHSLWHYDVAMFLAVFMAACSYLCTDQLVAQKHSIITINGLGMILGGVVSLGLTYIIKGSTFYTQIHWFPAFGYISSIVIIVNLIGLSLQLMLTQTYSVVLLALSSFITPLCGALFGLIQGDTWSYSLLGATLSIMSGLTIFYYNDMKRIHHATISEQSIIT